MEISPYTQAVLAEALDDVGHFWTEAGKVPPSIDDWAGALAILAASRAEAVGAIEDQGVQGPEAQALETWIARIDTAYTEVRAA